MFDFFLLFVSALLTGIYAVIVGGGALVLIPLFTLLGAPIHIAIGTSRVVGILPELIGVINFTRKKAINWKQALWFSLWGMIGGYLGARTVLDINELTLSYIVGALLLLLLLLLPYLDKAKDKLVPTRKVKFFLYIILGLVLGFYGGFFGAGFGTFAMYIFVLLGGLSLIKSVGNSRVLTLLMALTASYVFIIQGAVDWNLFLPTTLGMSVGAWVGSKWAVSFDAGWIKVLLALIIIASVIKLFFFPG
jgi:uncharacterized protein